MKSEAQTNKANPDPVHGCPFPQPIRPPQNLLLDTKPAPTPSL